MRNLSRLFTIAAATLAAVALAASPMAPAFADPPAGVAPRPADIVGVGSGILQYLFDQYSHDYNKTVSTKAPHLYSFDSVGPATGLPFGLVTLKHGCKPLPRPPGSSAGITALLKTNGKPPVITASTTSCRPATGRPPIHRSDLAVSRSSTS